MITLLVALLVLGCGSPDASIADAPVVVEHAALRHGDVHRYAFSWRTASEGNNGLLGEVPLQGDVALEGELSARVFDRGADGTRIGVRFSRIDEQRIGIHGHNVLTSADMLTRDEAVVVVPPDGRPRMLYFPPASPSVFRRLMEGVLAHLDLTVPPAGDRVFTAIGPTGNGLAELDYARDGTVVRRRVAGYVRVDAISGARADDPWQIDAEASIAIGDDALVDAIDLAEDLVLHTRERPELRSHTEFSLHRVGIDHAEPASAPDLSALVARDLFEAPGDEEAERELARRFAQDTTVTDLLVMAQSAGRGLVPRPGELARARGLLRGWPETALELAPLWAEAPDAEARAFVLDLLVSADTPLARDVAIDLLAEQTAANELPELLQHLVLLRTPTVSVAQFLLDVHAWGDAVQQRAVLYPMGSIAARLQATDPLHAEALVSAIRRALAAAESPDDVRAALAGLGNAGRSDDADAVLAWAHTSDRDVRAQVASSLRFWPSARVDDTLFDLLADADRFVAAAALSVIDFYRPEDDALRRLAAAAINGTVHPDIAGPVVTVLARRGLEDRLCRQAMWELHERSTDFRERLRIERILGLDRAGV
jgi:hypothetical protein